MINTYTASMYLIDDIEELIRLKYSENEGIRLILTEFQQDLHLIHDFTRKLVDFENEKIDNTGLREAYNLYRSQKSMNLLGVV